MADRSAHGFLAPQLFDRGIDMGGGNMRTKAVKRGELLFEGSQHGLRVGIARRGR